MGDNTIIKNKAEFETTAQTFLNKIFNPVLDNNLGDIEIRTFPNGHWLEQYFYQTTKEAAEIVLVDDNFATIGVSVRGKGPRWRVSLLSETFRGSVMTRTLSR